MRRIVATTVLATAFAVTAMAGDFRPATPEETAEVLAEVELSPAELGSLRCHFTQTRRTAMLEEALVTRGVLTIDAPKTLVWEVTEPYSSRSVVALDSDKRMKAMGRKNDFDRKLFISSDTYRIEMTPLKRDLKQLFAGICAWIDKATGDVRKVVLTEASGDTTTIEFHGITKQKKLTE